MVWVTLLVVVLAFVIIEFLNKLLILSVTYPALLCILYCTLSKGCPESFKSTTEAQQNSKGCLICQSHYLSLLV